MHWCSVCSLIIEIIHIYQMLHKFVKEPNIFSCLKMIHQWFRYHNTTLMVTGKMSDQLIWQDLELERSNLQRKRNRKFVQKDNTMAYNNADVVFEKSHFSAQVEEKYSIINVHYPFIVFSWLAQMNSNENVMLLSNCLNKDKVQTWLVYMLCKVLFYTIFKAVSMIINSKV